VSEHIERQIAALEEMDGESLRAMWRRDISTIVPNISPKMLRLALAWEIQAKAFGGYDRLTLQRLEQLARGLTQTRAAQPGMRLVREWQGRVHVVVVGGDGMIRWNDRQWRSLSEVARAITGTRWSGPAFFGLKTKRAAA
jgi:hypothetical protein